VFSRSRVPAGTVGWEVASTIAERVVKTAPSAIQEGLGRHDYQHREGSASPVIRRADAVEPKDQTPFHQLRGASASSGEAARRSQVRCLFRPRGLRRLEAGMGNSSRRASTTSTGTKATACRAFAFAARTYRLRSISAFMPNSSAMDLHVRPLAQAATVCAITAR